MIVDGAAAWQDLDYRTGTAPITVADGIASVEVQGSLPTGTAPVIGPVDLDPEDAREYTVVALGDVAAIEPLVLSDDNRSLAAGGGAPLRVILMDDF